MSEKDARAKRQAIRQEIKERMQNELDERKQEIKRRIRRENISVADKREKYRREVREEKLRLMQRAKEEFKARKRMLSVGADEEHAEDLFEEPPPIPDDLVQETARKDEEAEYFRRTPDASSGKAFIYDEEEDEEEALRELSSPIGEADAMPPDARRAGSPPEAEYDDEYEEAYSTPSIFHYIVNLVIHPLQTLDEFDDYLASPSGLVKVTLFYLASILLPLALIAIAPEGINQLLPRGLVGSVVRAAIASQPDPLPLIGRTILNLVLYAFVVAIVNFFVTGEANFLTLLSYFGFVEGVTRCVIYTMVIVISLAALVAYAVPPLMVAIGSAILLLFLAFLIWTFVLNIIVLMSAYDYDFFTALALAVGAGFVQNIILSVLWRYVGDLGM